MNCAFSSPMAKLGPAPPVTVALPTIEANSILFSCRTEPPGMFRTSITKASWPVVELLLEVPLITTGSVVPVPELDVRVMVRTSSKAPLGRVATQSLAISCIDAAEVEPEAPS